MALFSRISHCIAAAMILVAQSAYAKETANLPDEVVKTIEARIDDGTYVGVMVGVISSNGSSFYSFGSKSLTENQAPDEYTVYEIGSITKTFTSLLLADLAVKNELNLKDPILKHLPEGMRVPTYDNQHITLLNLATHTSALPRLPNNLIPKNPHNPYADYSTEDMYKYLSEYSLPRGIGEKYEYSNFAAGLLGHILASRNHSDYEEVFTKRIAKIIGLKETGIKFPVGMKNNFAQGTSGGLIAENWDFSALAGAGALRSTAHDMVLFLAANMGLHKTSLYPAMQMTHEPRITHGVGPNMSIGLGWHIRSTDDTEIVWHNGGTGGYRSFAGFLRDGDLGVVVLTNSISSVDDLGFQILDPTLIPHKGKQGIQVSSKTLKTYEGIYQLAPEFFITISADGERLMAQATGQGQFRIFPISEAKFFYKVVDAQITFNLNKEGNVEGLTLHQNGQSMLGKKI